MNQKERINSRHFFFITIPEAPVKFSIPGVRNCERKRSMTRTTNFFLMKTVVPAEIHPRLCLKCMVTIAKGARGWRGSLQKKGNVS